MVAFTSLNSTPTMPSSSSSSSLTKKEKQALKLFKKELQKAFPNQLHSLKLFGSKARGDAAKYSDVDVLVVLKRGRWRQKRKLGTAAVNVLLETGVVLSLKAFSLAQINRMRRRRAAFWNSIAKDLRPL
jgi:predicted nucleotidyltransferase